MIHELKPLDRSALADEWVGALSGQELENSVLHREIRERWLKVLKEGEWQHTWVGSIWERLNRKIKDHLSKTHYRSCQTKHAFWHPKLWHKKTYTWDRIHKARSVTFSILPLSQIQPHLTGTECLHAWPWNNLLRHAQTCFEVSGALEAYAHMHQNVQDHMWIQGSFFLWNYESCFSIFFHAKKC